MAVPGLARRTVPGLARRTVPGLARTVAGVALTRARFAVGLFPVVFVNGELFRTRFAKYFRASLLRSRTASVNGVRGTRYF